MLAQRQAGRRGPPVLVQLSEDLVDGAPDHVADAPHLQCAPLARLAHADHRVRVAGVPLEVHHLRACKCICIGAWYTHRLPGIPTTIRHVEDARVVSSVSLPPFSLTPTAYGQGPPPVHFALSMLNTWVTGHLPGLHSKL